MPDSGRTSYGSAAEHVAASVPPGTPAIVFDHTGAAQALRDGVWRRFRGEQFFVRPILQREDSVRSGVVAASIMRSFSDPDQRRVAVAQALDGSLHANERALRDIPAYDAGALRLMQALVRLSDGVIVSSHAERRRLQELLKSDPPAFFEDLRDPAVPVPAPQDLQGERDALVIWAPEIDADAALLFCAALHDVHLPLLVVSRTPLPGNERASWVPPESGSAALQRAKVLLVTNAYGADTALALAAWQTPMLVDAESGAAERVRNVRSFDRRDLGSITDAAASALGGAPPIERAVLFDSAPPDEDLLQDGPLVSIVMPTFNRPVLLRYALESCKRQTYRNVETIVAVGGGARFDELAEEFPQVRFIHLERNVPAESTNAAFAAASGTYVTVLNDDDVFFPNHVAALVTALERSGAAAAHADVLTAYLRGSDEQWMLYGFESNMSRSVDLGSMLVANRIGATSAMIRRSCIPEGPLDMSVPYYRDYALWLGLATQHDLVHVDRITSCYTIRNHGAAQQSTTDLHRAVTAYEAIYARYPASGRPTIEQQRAQMLASVRAGATALVTEPAMQVEPVEWPPF